MIGATGGDKAIQYLAEIGAKIGQQKVVKVGFLADATYPDGMPIAYIAAINEFGGSWPMPGRDVTIYRKVSKRTGDWLRGAKLVKRRESNFATTHQAKPYTHEQPPRPFFRRMIADNKDAWGPQTARLLRDTKMDADATLNRMGAEIEGQLQDSIKTLTDPPLAQSTVRAKGFSKPLIGGARDSGGGGLMWQSTGHAVVTEGG